MANRVVIQADIDSYAAQFIGFPIQMQLGDILINTRTNAGGVDGKGAYFCATTATTFAGARNGASIWIDGASLGTLYDFRFTNGGGGVIGVPSDADHWNHIIPIPNTQVKVWRNTTTNAGYTVLILDLKFWRMWGENDSYPGKRDGHPGIFARGKFGFWISGDKQLTSAHMLSVDCLDGGACEIIGVEVEHGFSAVRFTGGSYNRRVTPREIRCYLHDGISGEGNYWGATHGYPFAALVGPVVEDTSILRRAAESVQIQHLINNPSIPARVHHNIIKDGAIDYVNAFQPYQDSGIQVSVEGGTNYIENNMVDEAAASNQFVTYSDNGYENDQKTTTVRNNTFLGGDIFLYINVSCIRGVKWVFRDNTIGRFRNLYQEDSGEPTRNYVIGSNNGTDKFIFLSNTFDSTRGAIFQNTSNFDILDNTTGSTAANPIYKNSGFLVTERPVKYDQFWGDYHPNTNGTPFTVYTNRVYINAVDGVEYRFYKATATFSATALTRPDLYPAGWLLLTWDAAGVRNDWVGHNSGDTQSFYPPDNYELEADDPYNILGRGLYGNAQNTAYTQYQWYRADDALGTNAKAIPRGKTRQFTPDIAEKAKYVRLGIRVKDKNGNLGAWKYSSWKLVA